MKTYISELGRLCRKWGGNLKILSLYDFETTFCIRPRSTMTRYEAVQEKITKRGPWLYEAPFIDWHGIDWKNKIVYAVEGREREDAIIHEMGHVFATNSLPDNCEEWEFFGWEICLAKYLGCFEIWSKGNSGYNITNGAFETWGSLTDKEQYEVARERAARALELGIINKRKRPLAIR